jgi:predicted nucleotidyltransferase
MSTTGTFDIATALFGRTRRNVLALLYSRPEASFYLRQIVREAGGGVGAVQRELQHLTEAGILLRSARGREVHYQANRAGPVFEELRSLMLKTAGLADVLRGALAPLGPSIARALVYGSQAAGSATAQSDVDLLVVGAVEELALHRAIRGAEERLGRTVNYTLLTPSELKRRQRQRGGFIARILRGPTIGVLGDASAGR